MEPTLKVLQRRAYSFLLTRAGCGFALVSLLLTLNTLIAVVFGGCYVRTILTVRAPRRAAPRRAAQLRGVSRR